MRNLPSQKSRRRLKKTRARAAARAWQKPEEPKKAESEGAQDVPAAEAKKDEDERFQAAMQPPKLDESKKAEGEGARP